MKRSGFLQRVTPSSEGYSHERISTRRSAGRDNSSQMNKPLIYIACPYSFNGRDDEAARAQRYDAVTRLGAKLMSEGRSVFSPITHGHPMNLLGVRAGWETWATIDEAILLSCCNEMIVLMLDGWWQSKGIAAEIELATKAGIPITYIDPTEEKEG